MLVGVVYDSHMNETPTVTTIKVSMETWRGLSALKQMPGDTMDDVVRRLIEERRQAQERKP